MTQRREAFFAAVERVRVSADAAAYIMGCRAVNPSQYDNEETRKREQRHYNDAVEAQRIAVREFNAAVRAAARGRGGA